ncbi:hypothetical protein B9Z19DRAFT_1136151 [Tuber borchii]|uniref:Uncharacterized protein n=1 Tax=Tuber borchii TaxID=42251 RepID=A0A2T6ZC29_TUBBO|nr:hypothetical protein B9Z19DRAFT_1136151 [Tuber borchii]
MPSTYKWKSLLAGAHGHSVNPEMIRRNKNRANLSPLETVLEFARANWGYRLKQCSDFARGYDEYQARDDETKAEVDREMTVAASVEPAVGLARAATFDTSHTREPISGHTRFKIRLGRRNPGTHRPEETHTSPSMPTSGEDHTSEYQLTAEDMKGGLDMTD